MKITVKIAFLFLFGGISLFAQISPGELTKAHAELEGLSNCTKCHTLGDKVANDKCLACHAEIKVRIEQDRGYHVSSEAIGKNCSACHSEHFGRDFEIVHFHHEELNHDLTGFKLLGEHAKLKCDVCHASKFIVDNNKTIKNRKNTFLGLSQKCASCHENYHKETLSTDDCRQCHGFNDWKKAEKFDHQKTDFPLEGKHKNVKCEGCHKITGTGENKFQEFTGFKFGRCGDCHADVHKGKFGKNCKSCHVVNGFAVIKNRKNFDHGKTGFILKGKHSNVKCESCHKSGFKQKIDHQFCADCHEDYHKGEFSRDGLFRDCAECHDEKGFKSSSFSIEEHNKSQFALSGAHLAVPCTECHLTEERWTFRKKIECIACHENKHGNEIALFKDGKGNCLVCHITDGWKTVNFDHDQTKFKLEGKHKNVHCSECHFSKEERTKIFSKIDSACLSCHEDYHSGQFQAAYDNDCKSCHGFEGWSAKYFDHSKTKFKLEGAHKNVDCEKCHKKETINGKITVKYKMESIACSVCHS
ncbi:MAG: cytochrome C [Chlorobi bacterium]|nr:cytochrome C [Chlorobiota bacterium]